MELQNLQSIFNEKLFRIPDYQRGYSWGEQQWQDLWQDLDIMQKEHYTGMLAVIEKKDSRGKTVVDIVDGQQRITTLIILIKAILDSACVKGKEWINEREKTDYEKKYLYFKTGEQGKIIESIFGYDKDNPSHFHFQKEILKLKPFEETPATLYTRNLDKAREFFKGKVGGLEFKEAEILLRKATEQLKFNYYKIDNELNHFVAFETMNNRGKGLSDLELLKNRLIYISTLLPDPDQEEKNKLRNNINEAWKTIYEYLGKNEASPLEDDDFLRDHWIMKFGYGGRDSPKVYKKFLLNDHFTAERVLSGKLGYADIENYAKDIQNAVKEYFFLHHQNSGDNDLSRWLSKLQRIDYGAFRPLIMALLVKKSDGKIQDDDIVDILKSAERFCFIAFYIHFFQRNKKDTEIYRCATKFHNGDWNLKEIKGKLTLASLEISDKKLREDFCETVKEKYEKRGFYRWRGLLYFLYEYELHLQGKGGKKLKWEDVNTETIEHILPQDINAEWRKYFSADDAETYRHDLGNLLLLSQTLNSSIKNSSFAEKKKTFSSWSHSAIEVSKIEEWKLEEITKRTNKMLDFLWENWGLKE